MQIDSTTNTASGMIGQANKKEEQSASGFQDAMLAAAKSGKTSAESEEDVSDARKTYNRIVDTGFRKYVQEMRKEELEEKLRAKILQSLGLTEEQLGYMAADKIAEIEKSIQEMMRQIMAENGQVRGQEQKEKGQVYVPIVPGVIG